VLQHIAKTENFVSRFQHRDAKNDAETLLSPQIQHRVNKKKLSILFQDGFSQRNRSSKKDHLLEKIVGCIAYTLAASLGNSEGAFTCLYIYIYIYVCIYI